jgi:hypothetical protein
MKESMVAMEDDYCGTPRLMSCNESVIWTRETAYTG